MYILSIIYQYSLTVDRVIVVTVDGNSYHGRGLDSYFFDFISVHFYCNINQPIDLFETVIQIFSYVAEAYIFL